MKNIKHESIFTLHLKDDEVRGLLKDIKDSKQEVKTLRVKIEATHSGIVNGNKKFYTPEGMRSGADSFVKPYPKPVTVNHDNYSSPLGRIVSAKYVSYGINRTIDSLRPVGAVDLRAAVKIQSFLATDSYKASEYKGLGHIELIAEINDKDAIQKIIDKRYLTVSIGGGSNAMYCSTCGVDNKIEYCNHSPGATYDGKECFFISGDKMTFDHVSYVNSPADQNTNSEVLDCSDESKITILDYVMVDKGTTMNLIDFLKSTYPTYGDFAKYMGAKGLASKVSDEAFAGAKEADCLIVEDKILPIFDKAHAIASFLILQDSDIDGKDKDDMLQIVEDKIKSLCGDEFVLSDELAALVSEQKTTDEPVAKTTDVTDTKTGPIELSDEAVASIVTKVVDELKKSFNLSDSFAASRLKSIQKVNDNLELEVQSLTSKLRTGVIDQILSLEDKLADDDYRQKLVLRNTTSLEDKLSDLLALKIKDDKVVDKDLDKNNTTLEPNSVDKGGVIVDATNSDTSETQPVTEQNPITLSNEEIVDEYKRLIREKGLSAAKVYFQTLKDENKIPNNFTFNGVK